VTQIRREAFLVSPWEVNESKKAANISYGMTNAYCIVALWKHDTRPPRKAFHPLGNGIKHIPGCLHLIDFECCTERSWSLRRLVAGKIVKVLSKSGNNTHTRVSFNLLGITLSQWNHFKNRTIPLQQTEKKGIITKRTTRKDLVTEMIRDRTINHFARFDTAERLAILKGFFGDSIQGAGRVSRVIGVLPTISRLADPAPVFLAKRLDFGATVGALIRLPEAPTASYYSESPGIDFLYYPEKEQLTVRIRYTIEGIEDPIIRQQLLGLPPLPAQNNAPLQLAAPPAVVPGANFELEGSVFVIRRVTDQDGVVSEVVETDDDDLEAGDEVIYAFDAVQQAVIDYYQQ
jgi:hypothetical protein